MQRRPALFLPALLMLSQALPALAGDGVAGKWTATIENPRGTNEVTMEFTGSDEELKGTWSDRRGSSDLADVKFADGKLTFVRNLEFNGNAVTINYSATIDGDTMNVTMSTPRGEREFTAKRAE
jgi:hypothetical protein